MAQPEYARPDTRPPARLGRYALGRELGRGFSSIVYEAVDTRRGRPVALKVLTLSPGHTPARRREMVERFEREAHAVSALSHPAIVAIYDVGHTDDGQEYLAMERLEGETLRARLERGGPLLRAEALPLMVQVADALQYAHGRGIVHRDVKPDNIFLCADGTARLMDFGVARVFADDGLTQTGAVVGSPAYMSPEQINGDAPDGRSDVFSLAVTLVEALTGRKPFDGPTIPAVMNRILNQPPQMAGVSPSALCRALERALAKTPAARTPSAGAFAESLRRVQSPSASGEMDATRMMVRPARRRRGWALGPVAALVLAALGLVALLVLAAVTRRPPPVTAAQAVTATQAIAPVVTAPVRPPVTVAPPAVSRPDVIASLPDGDGRITEQTPSPATPPLTLDTLRDARDAPLDPSPNDGDTPAPTQTPTRTWFPAQAARRPAPANIAADAAPPTPDTPPRLVGQAAPQAPLGVPPQALPATVGLLLAVNQNGDVFRAQVTQSSGDERIDAAAIADALTWQYVPASRAGRAVAAQTPALVTFPR